MSRSRAASCKASQASPESDARKRGRMRSTISDGRLAPRRRHTVSCLQRLINDNRGCTRALSRSSRLSIASRSDHADSTRYPSDYFAQCGWAEITERGRPWRDWAIRNRRVPANAGPDGVGSPNRRSVLSIPRPPHVPPPDGSSLAGHTGHTVCPIRMEIRPLTCYVPDWLKCM